MSKVQDDFERVYLIGKRLNPNDTFYIKSRRKKDGYRHKELNDEFNKYKLTIS